jgi:RHS repeat-associated protein
VLYKSTKPGGLGQNKSIKFTRGEKLFELSNHLGNVLVTVTERRKQFSAGDVNVDYYVPDVASANDYYPFGMSMPGRKYEAQSGYRYGINRKEKDKDICSLTEYDYGFRVYSPSIGKFLSIDPLSQKYPWYTPYQFAGNKPIKYIDLEGAEPAEEELDPEAREERFEEMEENIRENNRLEEEREREEHIRQMNTNPAYRNNQLFSNGLVQSMARQNYWQNAFNSASFVLSGTSVTDNKRNGNGWDDLVSEAILKNPTCIGVGRQISFKVVGMVNGKQEVAKIRIDNVGIHLDPVTRRPILNFTEAKYSIGEIKDNNVSQFLTSQQKSALSIIINGTDVNIFIRGTGSTNTLNNILMQNNVNQKLSNGQSVLGHIGEISVMVPSGNAPINTNNTVPNVSNTNSSPNSSSNQPAHNTTGH